MPAACPIPTPEQRRCAAIAADAASTLLASVSAALDEAAAAAAAGFAASGSEASPPGRDYFVAMLHQSLFCCLCGADPDTFAGGRPDIALALIRNAENIARHYWGADIAPDPARPPGRPTPD